MESLRHPGFNMRINNDPQNSAMCQIGSHLLPPGQRRVSTYIGTSGQNDMCFQCLDEAFALKKKRPAVSAAAAAVAV